MNSMEVPRVDTICSRSNHAWLLKTLPVRRWHSRQWHIETRTGSPSHVMSNCPQLHAARRVVITATGLLLDDATLSHDE
jgi:hypothetical protein